MYRQGCILEEEEAEVAAAVEKGDALATVVKGVEVMASGAKGGEEELATVAAKVVEAIRCTPRR